jgi:exodeoxyribonuclease VII small subunit
VLEEKARAIKKEDITLEEAMKAYEEGVKYYEICENILNDAKGKITLLKEKSGE